MGGSGMYDLLLIRYGEIGTKGKNRYVFEQRLQANIERALRGLGIDQVERAHARFYVPLQANAADMVHRLEKVFGIASISPVKRVPLSKEAITEAALEIMGARLSKEVLSGPAQRTFKVETKRANKGFPYTSPEMNRDLGADLLQAFPNLSVEV